MKKLHLILQLSILLFAISVKAQAPHTPVPDKLVVLTFDDAIASQANIVAPLLKKYGFGATFFVCEFLTPPFSDKTKYMTWEQIEKLNSLGFEIGNHTQNHTHVTKLDRAHFTAELEYIENKCAAYHIPKLISFAYPGYDTAPSAISVLKDKGYLFARAGNDVVYDPQVDHPYLIPGFTTTATNSKQIYEALQSAKNGKIVVLTIHGVPDSAHVWVNTPPELFEGYLKYMHDNHYKVIAMRDLRNYVDLDKAFKLTPIFKKQKQ